MSNSHVPQFPFLQLFVESRIVSVVYQIWQTLAHYHEKITSYLYVILTFAAAIAWLTFCPGLAFTGLPFTVTSGAYIFCMCVFLKNEWYMRASRLVMQIWQRLYDINVQHATHKCFLLTFGAISNWVIYEEVVIAWVDGILLPIPTYLCAAYPVLLVVVNADVVATKHIIVRMMVMFEIMFLCLLIWYQ